MTPEANQLFSIASPKLQQNHGLFAEHNKCIDIAV